ncbi:MAG: PHP domain-containing protein [Halanaeroarchaeum sp.]
MVYADLHVHTDVSDGTLSLSTIPDAARRAGVGVVGVTDHDRLHPGLDDPVTTVDGVEVVAGVELRVDTGDQRVDLLGYGVEPTDALQAELDRIQRDRARRGRAIVECVEDRLGVSLDVEIGEGLGRPNIARAVVGHPDTAYERIDEVFEDLIGMGDPCFVLREVPDFANGLSVLREASTLVSLAHPFRYDDPAAALERCDGLDAVETAYPYDRVVAGNDEDRARILTETVERYDLLETGGSDAHGTTLGAAGLSKSQYERVADRLPAP